MGESFIDVPTGGWWTYENAGQLVGAGWVSGTCAIQCAGDCRACFRSSSAESQEIRLSLRLTIVPIRLVQAVAFAGVSLSVGHESIESQNGDCGDSGKAHSHKQRQDVKIGFCAMLSLLEADRCWRASRRGTFIRCSDQCVSIRQAIGIVAKTTTPSS